MCPNSDQRRGKGDKEKLQERVAKLSGGVALIRVQKVLEKLKGANAASVAGLLLTTEVMIAEAPKEEEHSHAGGGMPGGMDM